MIVLTLPGMTCGGCAGAVTRTLQALDPQAEVEVDLPTHQVNISTSADRDEVETALTRAGFPPA